MEHHHLPKSAYSFNYGSIKLTVNTVVFSQKQLLKNRLINYRRPSVGCEVHRSTRSFEF